MSEQENGQAKESKKIFIGHRIFVLAIISAIAFIITACMLNFMSDQVPMHYNAKGEIDRYGSKYENYIFPVMITIFNIFWVLMISLYDRKSQKAEEDKRREEAKNNSKILYWTAIGTSFMFIAMQCIFLFVDIYSEGMEKSVSFDMANMAITVAMGISFIFLGNIVAKTKLNGLMGVRTSWSMANDTTWRLSNRFGGKVMVISGLVTIFCGFFFKGMASTYAMLAVVIVMSIVSVAYSYKVYQKYGKQE